MSFKLINQSLDVYINIVHILSFFCVRVSDMLTAVSVVPRLWRGSFLFHCPLLVMLISILQSMQDTRVAPCKFCLFVFYLLLVQSVHTCRLSTHNAPGDLCYHGNGHNRRLIIMTGWGEGEDGWTSGRGTLWCRRFTVVCVSSSLMTSSVTSHNKRNASGMCAFSLYWSRISVYLISHCLAQSLQTDLMSYYQSIIDYQDFATGVKTLKATESNKTETWTVKYQ